MANLNVNIAKKLISYVRHGVDINEDIKAIYNNSLIFIGDEQQIFVPAMNTYVGIGMTAYNATIQRIDDVENQIKQLADTLTADLVAKIYPNYSMDEMLGTNGNNGIKSTGETPPVDLKAGKKDLWALNNEVTIKGVNDYDPTTGFARTNANPYVLNGPDDSEYTTITVTNSYWYHKDEHALPTSGIKVTPHWGDFVRVENPITGQAIEKRVGNYIAIDDELTWSYMTSAYAYTLAFSQKYTASEVDRLYHNLLGDYRDQYLPVSFGSKITNATNVISELDETEYTNYDTNNPGKHLITLTADGHTTYYVVDISEQHTEDNVSYSGVFVASYDPTYSYQTAENPQETVIGSPKTFTELTIDQYYGLFSQSDYSNYLGIDNLVEYTPGNSEISGFPQLYTKDSQYDSTYNMNIADGINTLKEVAYLLDKLSDGSLGTTTYITYGQVSGDNASNLTFTTGSDDKVTYFYTVDDTDYAVNLNTKQLEVNSDGAIVDWHAPKDDDMIGWYVIQGDQENLGIQIAYSIAGNKQEIDDLHTHTDLIEQGRTTLRSIQTTNSEFATLTMAGQNTNWADTDSHQGADSFDEPGHPNWNVNGNQYKDNTSYSVGDVNLRINLNTATVYATTYSATLDTVNTKSTDAFGVDWYGCYTAADMNSLTIDGSYYIISGGTEDAPIFEAVDTQDLILDSRYQAANLQYYWIPNDPTGELAKNGPDQNLIYTKISREDLTKKSDNDYLDETSHIKKGECVVFYKKKEDGTYEPLNGAAAGQTAANYALTSQANAGLTAFYYVSGFEYNKIHDVEGENKLATTQWVGAHVDRKIGKIADDIEDVLEKAKEYTNKKIDALDNEYIYTDFASYWTAFLATIPVDEEHPEYETTIAGTDENNEQYSYTFVNSDLVTPGSAAYDTTYARFYTDYKLRAEERITVFGTDTASDVYDENTNPYRLSYQSKSQYVFNTVEENGIVTAEARELPTDTIKANVQVWGDDSNIASTSKHVYRNINLSTGGSRHKRGTSVSLFDALYRWSSTTEDNQIFVEELSENVFTYIPLDPTDVNIPSNVLNDINRGNYVGGTDNTLYKLSASNTIVGLTNDDMRSSDYDYHNTADKKWYRLYQKGPAHIELDFSKAQQVVTTTNGVTNIDNTRIIIGDYLLKKLPNDNNVLVYKNPTIDDNSPEYTVTNEGTQVTINGEPSYLKCIDSKATSSAQYLSVENKHFSFKENGNGENELSVTAHITRIEDASQSNTGFADAFDVQTYVENYFTWIDISASVTQNRVDHSDDYYKVITLEQYGELTGTPSLYKRTDHNEDENFAGTYWIDYTAIPAGQVATAYFWKDDDTRVSGGYASLTEAEAAAIATPGVHVQIDGKYVYEQFDSLGNGDYDVKKSNYFIRTEEPKINPVNLTESVYGEVPINNS